MQQQWFDYKLKWDPSEYGGIEDINVPAEQIWLPDIVLYNSAEGYFAVSIMTKAKVRYDGRVTWNPPAIFRSSCQIDITYFPFDSQNCRLKFGSWTFGATIDLRHVHINNTETYIERGTDLSEYYQNVEWDIMVASARRNVITYACCPNDEYPDVTFDFTLRRKPLFYTVNLILPCVGITILSFLVFYLPSDSGEKVTLTISILVSLIFFLSVLIETIPSTSLAMPLLGKYLVFTMILITLSVCATVFVLNIHFRTPSTHSMPNWVKRWCIDILPKYLFLNVPQYQSSQTNILPEQLIYSHNPVYANNNMWPTPEQLQRHQAGICNNQMTIEQVARMASSSSKKPHNNNNNNNVNSSSSNSASTSSGAFANNKKNKSSKGKHKLSHLKASSLEQEVTKLSISPSSLFLPYLQSEAARRLQMQRSRSSDRDTRNNSASEHFQMSQMTQSSTTTSITTNNSSKKCDKTTSKTIKKDKAKTSSSSTTNNAAALASGKQPSKNRKSDENQAQKNALLEWRLFSNAPTASISKRKPSKQADLEMTSRGGQQNRWTRQNSTSSDENNDNNDDDEEYEDYDYQHHKHFEARASIWSNNMWRIGPTRRCSVAQPINYPTFYHPPICQPASSTCQTAGCPGSQARSGGVSTISGGVATCCNHHHHHSRDPGGGGEDSESTASVREGAAVGALIKAAASNAAIRPKERLVTAAGMRVGLPPVSVSHQQPSQSNFIQASVTGLHLQPAGLQQQQQQHHRLLNPIYAPQSTGQVSPSSVGLISPPPLPTLSTNPSSLQRISGHLNQHTYITGGVGNFQQNQQQQQHQLVQPNHQLNVESSCSITNAPQRVNLNDTYQISSQQVPPSIHHYLPAMPRSRSTDHRLYAHHLNTGHSLQQQQRYEAPMMPIQQQRFSGFGPTNHGAQPVESQASFLLHNTQTIGRALGQAYMQRLQRLPALVGSNLRESTSINNLRIGRTMQRGNGSGYVGETYLLPLNNSMTQQMSLIGQQSYGDTMKRSKSQSALDHSARMVCSLNESSCDQCCKNYASENVQRNPPSRQQQHSQCQNMAGCYCQQMALARQVSANQYLSGKPSCCSSYQYQAGKNGLMVVNAANRQQQQQSMSGGGGGSGCPVQVQTDSSGPQISQLSLIRLINDVNKAMQNAMFIAQHIDNLDEFESIRARLPPPKIKITNL